MTGHDPTRPPPAVFSVISLFNGRRRTPQHLTKTADSIGKDDHGRHQPQARCPHPRGRTRNATHPETGTVRAVRRIPQRGHLLRDLRPDRTAARTARHPSVRRHGMVPEPGHVATRRWGFADRRPAGRNRNRPRPTRQTPVRRQPSDHRGVDSPRGRRARTAQRMEDPLREHSETRQTRRRR